MLKYRPVIIGFIMYQDSQQVDCHFPSSNEVNIVDSDAVVPMKGVGFQRVATKYGAKLGGHAECYYQTLLERVKRFVMDHLIPCLDSLTALMVQSISILMKVPPVSCHIAVWHSEIVLLKQVCQPHHQQVSLYGNKLLERKKQATS